MMFDVPVIERRRRRVVCKDCHWRGYRLDPTRLACPRCNGPVIATQDDKTPGLCCNCDHWQRNREFPNRYGVCNRDKSNFHPLTGQSTYELFGCTNHSRSKNNDISAFCEEAAAG